jgi:hypothetical protein
MKELKIKLEKFEEKGQFSRQSTPRYKTKNVEVERAFRCMWCDSVDHPCRKCQGFFEALRNNIVFFKEGRIHLKETGAQ